MSASIVVTGCGIVSAIGIGNAAFSAALQSETSGIRARENGSGAWVPIADFEAGDYVEKKGLRALDRSARLLAVAAKLALDGAAWTEPPGSAGPKSGAEPLGLVAGTMFGGLGSIAGFDWTILADGPQYVNPMHFPNTVISSPTGQAAIKHNLRGINSTICAGLASGLHALDYASRMLTLNRAPALLAGGVEEICDESAQGFERLGMLSPSGRPKPFADDRDGGVQGEGSTLFMLETTERAAARGARPLARLAGFASAHAKAGEPQLDHQARAASTAMRTALEAAGVSASAIGLIVASASGSKSGDAAEQQALESVFARPLGDLQILTPKKFLGETLGAGGAFAAAAAILAVSRPGGPAHALVNAIDCSGECASLVVSKLDNQPE